MAARFNTQNAHERMIAKRQANWQAVCKLDKDLRDLWKHRKPELVIVEKQDSNIVKFPKAASQ